LHIGCLYGTIIHMSKKDLKKIVQRLRSDGRTYSEIRNYISESISKSTISLWCRNVALAPKVADVFHRRIAEKLKRARLSALQTNQKKRAKYLKELRDSNIHLLGLIKNKDIAKLVLAALYLCEGSKNRNGALVFCNSDPLIIKLFLQLLRKCYRIDEKKFRCTLQCRADQNIESIERFWSKITHIPMLQFYGARIDPRTIGKPTKKKDYKGVCRIDCFSADIYNELTIIGQLFDTGR
jgi:hypothetical protein